MQINSIPVLHTGGAPATPSLASGADTAVDTREATFASTLARMRGDTPDDASLADPVESETPPVDADNSEAKLVEAAGSDGLAKETADRDALKVEEGASVAMPAVAVTEQSALQTDPAKHRDASILTANHSDENDAEVAKGFDASRAEALSGGSQKGGFSEISRGNDGGQTQLGEKTADGTARDQETIIASSALGPQGDVPSAGQTNITSESAVIQSAIAAPPVPARNEFVSAAEGASKQPGGRQANIGGIFNGRWGAGPTNSTVTAATQREAQIVHDGLLGLARAPDSYAGSRMVAEPETEIPVGSPMKVTVRSGASQPPAQISIALASGSVGPIASFSAIETTGADAVASVDETSGWTMSRSIGAAGITMPSSSEAMVARPETVRNAAAYAVEILAREPGKSVEIALNPEELGRVRMALSPSDAGVTVLITSERPETLELMRRYIEQLSQEFQKLGYQQASFEFNSESSSDGNPSPKGGHAGSDATSVAGETQNIMPTRLIQTGLDLRL